MNLRRPGFRRRAAAVVTALALAFPASGCSAMSPWTFSATRWSAEEKAFRSSTGSGDLALVALGLVLAIDLVLLPVSVPHDIWLLFQDAPRNPGAGCGAE